MLFLLPKQSMPFSKTSAHVHLLVLLTDMSLRMIGDQQPLIGKLVILTTLTMNMALVLEVKMSALNKLSGLTSQDAMLNNIPWESLKSYVYKCSL